MKRRPVLNTTLPPCRLTNSPEDRKLKAVLKNMAKELSAEHKRWNMPLLTWKDGKVVAVKP